MSDTSPTLVPLPSVEEGVLDLPTYDPHQLTPGIVHFGVGGFHRAHQAVYLHELAQRGILEWGVVGVAMHSRGTKDALEGQDLLYSVVERGEEDHVQVVGALVDVLHAPEEPDAVLDALTDPRVRLVTLTVTQDGYPVDTATGELRADAEDVVHDLEHPDRPRSFPGFLVTALDRRRRAGDGPLTVLSCDNVPGNGDVARAAVVGLARLRDAELADWIEAEVAFPGSMVDRITPQSSEEAAELIEEAFGVEDRSPVTTEPFRQWIVEDRFSAGRPPLEDVGVQLVDDVRPYELMKKRLLNGTHAALAYVGLLAGMRTADEVLADPVLHRYVDRLMGDEIAPTLPPVPGVDLDEYRETLLGRFANPKVRDELERLGRRGSAKVPTVLMPCLLEAREAGRPYALLTLAVAAWMRVLHGTDLAGEPIEVADARAEELRQLKMTSGWDPRPLLSDRHLFQDIDDVTGLAEDLSDALRALEEDGVHAAVRARLERA